MGWRAQYLMGFPFPVPTHCRECGNGKREVRGSHPASGRLLAPSRRACRRACSRQGQALRVAAKVAASLDRRSTRRRSAIAVGTEGWSVQSNIGMVAKAEYADIPRFSYPSIIAGRQSCTPKSHATFCCPAFSTRKSVDRFVTPFCFR